MRHWLPVLLLLCAAILCPGQTPNGYVTGKGVALRALPASYYERLAILPEGTPVEILSQRGEEGNQWVQVRLPVPVSGWVRGAEIDGDGVVIQESCPVHTGPGENFTAFHEARQGEVLQREGRQDGDWVCVQAPSQATAWISADFVARGAKSLPPVSLPSQEKLPAPVAVAGDSSLAELQRQAQERQSEVEARSRELQGLQEKAQKLEAERLAAQQKAEQAAQARQEALKQAEAEYQTLESERQQAQAKARLVQEDSQRWASEAKKAEEKLLKLQEEARRQEEAYLAEAQALEEERQRSDALARESLEKVRQAQQARDEALLQAAQLQESMALLEKEVQETAAKAEQLRQQRQQWEEAAQTEQKRLQDLQAQEEQTRLKNAATQEELTQLLTEREKLEAQLSLTRDASEQARLRQSQEQEQARKEAQESLEAARKELEALQQRQKELEQERAAMEEARKLAEQEEQILAAAQEKQLEDNLSQLHVSQPGERVPATLSGIVVPLGPNANQETTHALCLVKDGRYVPEAYLRAERFSLRDWEGQEVTVSGLQERKRGWSRPLLVVTGIVLQ